MLFFSTSKKYSGSDFSIIISFWELVSEWVYTTRKCYQLFHSTFGNQGNHSQLNLFNILLHNLKHWENVPDIPDNCPTNLPGTHSCLVFHKEFLQNYHGFLQHLLKWDCRRQYQPSSYLSFSLLQSSKLSLLQANAVEHWKPQVLGKFCKRGTLVWNGLTL